MVLHRTKYKKSSCRDVAAAAATAAAAAAAAAATASDRLPK
jgi:hypothetical protein